MTCFVDCTEEVGCARQDHPAHSVFPPEHGSKNQLEWRVARSNQSEEWSASGLLHGTCAVQSLHLPNDGVLARQSKKVVGVGVELKYKLDKKLFRRYMYTRNTLQRELSECAFEDDVVLLASTTAGAEVAVTEFQSTSSDFGLTVSIPKTKHMVAGREAKDRD